MSDMLFLSAKAISEAIGHNPNSVYRRAKKVAKDKPEAVKKNADGSVGIAPRIVYPQFADKWDEWEKDIDESAKSNGDEYADFQEIIQHPATEGAGESQVIGYLISEHQRLTQEVVNLRQEISKRDKTILLLESTNTPKVQESGLEAVKTPNKAKLNEPSTTEVLYVVIPAIVVIASAVFYFLVIA